MTSPPGPRVLCVAGPSGSGKTRLLRRLLPRLPLPPDRVGVLKHTHHALDWHPAGKDSAVLWAAGPAALGVAGPDQTAVFIRTGRPRPGRASASEPDSAQEGSAPGDPDGEAAPPDEPADRATRELAAACRRLPGELELILAEGYRTARAPTIWTAAGPPDSAPPAPGVRAVVVPAGRTAAWAAAHPEAEVRSREEAGDLAARVPAWAVPVAELEGG